MIVLNLQHKVLYLMTMMQWNLWKKQFSLAEIVAPDQFKTYDELKTRLDYVLGNKKSAVPQFEEEDIDRGEAEELVTAAVSKPTPAVAEEEDDALSYFAKLAEE